MFESDLYTVAEGQLPYQQGATFLVPVNEAQFLSAPWQNHIGERLFWFVQINLLLFFDDCSALFSRLFTEEEA